MIFDTGTSDKLWSESRLQERSEFMTSWNNVYLETEHPLVSDRVTSTLAEGILPDLEIDMKAPPLRMNNSQKRPSDTASKQQCSQTAVEQQAHWQAPLTNIEGSDVALVRQLQERQKQFQKQRPGHEAMRSIELESFISKLDPEAVLTVTSKQTGDTRLDVPRGSPNLTESSGRSIWETWYHGGSTILRERRYHQNGGEQFSCLERFDAQGRLEETIRYFGAPPSSSGNCVDGWAEITHGDATIMIRGAHGGVSDNTLTIAFGNQRLDSNNGQIRLTPEIASALLRACHRMITR